MQATLLSIAIAMILALLAALVGPHFVDWNTYRAEFESQASRMSGLQVRIAGPIEASLLPTPSVSLQQIEAQRPGEAGALRARRLSIEFSLGSLVRGEWKATDVRLDGPEISLVVDRDGRLEWPAPSVNFDPESISIERLDIRDARALLADAASGSSAVLDRIDFRGELRTLAGPVKGQGSFYLAGQHYPYRINAGRAVGDEGVRVRLNLDPIDRPFTADADGFISIDNGKPRFAGSVTLARSVTRAPAGSPTEILEPWRLTGKIDGNSSRAVIEQIEFQYGPDERPIRLRGDASVTLGASPRIAGVLSSPQVDLDRILALPEGRRPLTAIKTFADYFIGSQRLPIPVDLGIAIESLTLAGATLQRVSGDFSTEADGWTIENLEFRAPGLTQVAMAGRFGVGGDRISFTGRTKVDSKDPKTLIAWLTDRSEAQAITAKSLSLDGDFKLSSEEIAVDRLKAELDRMSVTGRLAYAWGTPDRPPRIEAVISAPDLDLDRAYGLTQGVFDGTVFDWPREGLLTARIDRATLAGVEALRTNVNMRFDAHGLNVERLDIGDFGGVALAVKGNIDTRAQAPRGSLDLDVDARRLDGLTALVERISPQAADELRRNAARIAPARLNVTLNVSGGKTSPAESTGHFKIAGRAGAFLVSLNGEIGADGQHLNIANVAQLRSAKVDIGAEIAARDGSALLELLGLERIVALDRGDGRFTMTARGALDSDLAVESSLVAPGLNVSAKGTTRFAGGQGPTAGMDVRVARANIRAPRMPGRAAATLPAAFTTQLSLAEAVIGLNDLSGKIAGTDISGRVTIALGDPPTIGGELALASADLPMVIAATVGLPPSSGTTWSAEPFEQGLIGSMDGAIKLRIDRVGLSPQLQIQDMRAALQFEPGALSVREIDGAMAGGRIAGSVNIERNADGITLGSQIRLAGVNVAEIIPGDGALNGRATVKLDLSGGGRSPIALIGSLKGEGTFTLQDGQAMRLDPSAFDAVIRSIDDGLPIDAIRVGNRMEAALNKGALPVLLAQGEIIAAAGQVRLANTAVQAKGADLGIRMSLDLASSVLDARLSLTGAAGQDGQEKTRPAVTLALHGPIVAPKRTLDVAAFANWLALRAIEERDKQIDKLEAGRKLGSAPLAPPPLEQSAPSGQAAVPTPSAPAPDSAGPETSAQQPSPARAPRAPGVKTAPPPPPAAAAPTDIRPPVAAKAQTPARQQAQPARPPASRSWFENLFGP